MTHRNLEYKVYQEQMDRFQNGIPLYFPQPLSGDYHVHIGDIGYIDHGQFHTVFNAFANTEETRAMNEESGTPDGFTPLDPDKLKIDEREAYGSQHVFETSDTYSVGSDVGLELWTRSTANSGVQLSISQSKDRAAFLSIRDSAKLMSARFKGAMRKHMLEQYEIWFKFISEQGYGIQLHDMIFVSDCHLTADWAIGVYTQTYTEGNFFSHLGNALRRTSTSLLSISRRTETTDVSIPLRYGPDHGRVMRSLQTQDETVAGDLENRKNQCIFLMGFHIADRDGLEKIKLKAAAEPRSPDMDRDTDNGLSNMAAASDSNWGEGQEKPWEREPHLFALQVIFENSDSDIAIVHELDIYALIGAIGYNFKSPLDLSELRQKGSKLEIITEFDNFLNKKVGMISYPPGEIGIDQEPFQGVIKLREDPQMLHFVQSSILTELRHLDLSPYGIFEESRVVGVGAFGDISRARYTLPNRGEIDVAVKRLRIRINEDIKILFEKEIYTWSKLSHVNILPLIGYAFENNTGYPLLVSEWMENGTSWSYVRINHTCDLIRLVTGAAEGLTYLHDINVVHADIKPDNILVSASGDALICDFGGSCMIPTISGDPEPTAGLRGTSRYLSYELVDSSDPNKEHTKESDVWALGMTLYALLTQQLPYDQFKEDYQVLLAITRRELPILPLSDSWTPQRLELKETLWNACQLCWNFNPGKRVTMPTVLSLLKTPSYIELDSKMDAERTIEKNVYDIRMSSPLGTPQVAPGSPKGIEEMDSASDDYEIEAGSHMHPRTYIRPALLAELSHLDLTGRASINNLTVVVSASFGDIFKSQCTLGDGKKITVAVKRLRFYLKEDIDLIFEKEIYVWSRLKHPNVLSLLGFAFEEPSGYPLLVSEWMKNGSSLNYVKNNNDCDLIRLVTGIAEGLAYLHDNGIVHSDINPDNIVVTDAGDARICDFGGSRIADASKSLAKLSTGIRGILRYLSYELVALPSQYTRHSKESDVWAFGMTVFALIAQEHPYALLREAQVMKAIADRELPSFDFWTTRSLKEKTILRNVCNLCWAHEPESRPGMSLIASSLRDSKQEEADSRMLAEEYSEQHIILSSSKDASSGVVTLNATRDVNLGDIDRSYKPLTVLSSSLEVLNEQADIVSEFYQYLRAAKKVLSPLYDVFTQEFIIDRKLDHLIRTMADVLAHIVAKYTTLDIGSGRRQSTLRLFHQVIECCLFIDKYSRKSLEERKLGAGDGRKMAEFIAFFVTFKEALELGTGILPAFISSRVARVTIDESVLRQRLRPSETDTKGQRLCLLGTRVEVQEQIIEWALSESSPNILWFHGVAGSGKSTVIASVAEHFRGIYRLGAFLGFTRGASDPSSVISTIAFELALFDSTIGSLVSAETDRDKDIVNASFKTQFEILLVDPLSAAAEAQQGPVIVILDALDECGTRATRKTLMQVLLHGFQRLPSNFKFLITSRREQDIDRAFHSLQYDSVTIVELDYTSSLSRRDVQSYLDHEIRSIVEDEDVPKDGSLEKQLLIFGEMAAGNFVWASAMVKLVAEHDRPLEKLAELASNPRSLGELDQLYSTILRNSGILWRDDISRTRFQRVIGLILLSKVPLTESTVDSILGSSVGNCRLTLSRLRSVIDYRPGEPIRLFHVSFADFLMSSSHTEDWFVDIPVQESFLAMRCFEIMKAELQFNICNLITSFICNDSVNDIEYRIESRISPHLSYACRFWSHHLCNISYGLALMEQLSAFLDSRLLYWLEVLSLLKCINIVGPVLLAITRWIGNNDAEIVAAVRDARRLISIFALPISQSVPHIYLSMLPLMADESRVSTHYLQHTSSLVRVTRKGVKRQSPLLKLLEGHTYVVTSVGFSPDGSLIVSGSWDETVRIWNTEKGELTARPFDGHVGWIYFIFFSPDGTRIIVGGYNGIAVLDAETGSIVVGPFGGYASSVAVSPDGKHIISTSSNVIKMWDLESGLIVGKPFLGHADKVQCAAYSRDGRFIVSGSKDRSVCVWDEESRRLVREPFIGHPSGINSVAFSPDGKLVVSGSKNDIRIWDLENGEVDYSPLIGHEDNVVSVAYSSDGTRIVSGSTDKTVKIWNAQNGQLVGGPFRHANVVNCVTFSPDGTRVVSGSEDGTLRIWDAESGKIDDDNEPERVRDVEAVRFSPDGSCIISDKGTTWRVEDGQVLSEGSGKREYRTLEITDGMQLNSKGALAWNPYTGRVITNHYEIGDYPCCMAISPNGKRIAFGSYDDTIKVWDRERDMLVWGPFSIEGGRMNSLIFAPDGSHIASGSEDLSIWDAETGELLFGPFAEHTHPVTSITYSPDGGHIASGSLDKTVRVWEIETGRSKVFKGHSAGVRSVSFSPDGSLLVSVSIDIADDDVDPEIRVWNIGSTLAVQDPRFAFKKPDVSKWTLDKDGWVRGAYDELMIWVPPDLRSTLCFPPNIAIINNGGFSTALDFSGSAQGERWHECFHLA